MQNAIRALHQDAVRVGRHEFLVEEDGPHRLEERLLEVTENRRTRWLVVSPFILLQEFAGKLRYVSGRSADGVD